jgi:hypothetical protein
VPKPEEGALRGAIVGAVQSGKTAVLGAVAARAMDLGYRIVVVLAGLRDDLRAQTARRLIRDLLWRGDAVYRWKGGEWVESSPRMFDHPDGKGLHGALKSCWSPHYKDDVNQDQAFSHLVTKKLGDNQNVLVVAKKNVRTLERLHEGLAFARRRLGAASVPLLVLDDECDEASVGTDSEKPTPEGIARLLLESSQQRTAYIGLTATIAASILQDPQNTLFPSSFIEVARFPAERDTALTYEEPDPDRRHSGGHVFYRLLEEAGEENLLISGSIGDAEAFGDSDDRPELEEALIAFYTSGAIRLAMQSEKTLDDPKRLATPHSMLIHTEGAIEAHWDLCHRVADIIRVRAGSSSRTIGLERRDPTERVGPDDLSRWLEREDGRWRNWHSQFLASRKALEIALPSISRPRFPSWEEARARLSEVFSHSKLRVINSDESADPPLDFSVPTGPDGRGMPYDHYGIVIGGNRLSRGLTIEGLCVSYYTRSSRVWAEDTAVQRERWFGYRGPFLEFCRVFLHPETALRFRRFHEHDLDLREQLAWILREGRAPRESAMRLMCLPDSTPTHQRSRGQDFPMDLSGMRIFVDRVQMGDSEEELAIARANEVLAATWWGRLKEEGEPRLGPDGAVIGYLLRDVDMDDVLGLLEGLEYTFHNPDPQRSIAVALQSHHVAARDRRKVTGLGPRSCPFLTAAYLRYWRQAFADVEAGKDPGYRSEDGLTEWSPCPPPTFSVGFRFGTLNAAVESEFQGARLLNRTVFSDGRVSARWGGHGKGEGYYGDEWFDLDPLSRDPTERRRVGMPGLVLIHVAHRGAQGIKGDGTSYSHDRPFVGVCLPRGGPSFQCVIAEGVAEVDW